MKFCMLRTPVKKNGECRYQYQSEDIDVAFYESYSKQLDMYFYQLQNLGIDFISLSYGDGDKAILLAPNQITDLSFAEFPKDRSNFYMSEQDFQSIIKDNIICEEKTLKKCR